MSIVISLRNLGNEGGSLLSKQKITCIRSSEQKLMCMATKFYPHGTTVIYLGDTVYRCERLTTAFLPNKPIAMKSSSS